jgi:hypothetical protein
VSVAGASRRRPQGRVVSQVEPPLAARSFPFVVKGGGASWAQPGPLKRSQVRSCGLHAALALAPHAGLASATSFSFGLFSGGGSCFICQLGISSPPQKCSLTPRSSRAPTAGRQAQPPQWCLLRLPGLASHRRCRLSSNVRLHTPGPALVAPTTPLCSLWNPRAASDRGLSRQGCRVSCWRFAPAASGPHSQSSRAALGGAAPSLWPSTVASPSWSPPGPLRLLTLRLSVRSPHSRGPRAGRQAFASPVRHALTRNGGHGGGPGLHFVPAQPPICWPTAAMSAA